MAPFVFPPRNFPQWVAVEGHWNRPVGVWGRWGSCGVVKVSLPGVHAPVMKVEWAISADTGRVLVPRGGGLELNEPVLSETGLATNTLRSLELDLSAE